MFGGALPCGSCPWCTVRSWRAGLCLAVLGLVVEPSLCGTSALGGYVTTGMALSGTVVATLDGSVPFFVCGVPPAVVAGIPLSAEEDRQDSVDDSALPSPWDRRSGTQVLPGSGRSAPANSNVRKRNSSPDVVFFTDRSSSRSAAARLADYGDTVNLIHPCAKRLFRPPRVAPC